jgi:hypothetical protein
MGRLSLRLSGELVQPTRIAYLLKKLPEQHGAASDKIILRTTEDKRV